ncbi:MAG: CsbD family protein [Nitrospiraceae bacterium]
MNADHFKGKWNQFKGELKKKWGEFTDDDLMKIEGNYDQFKGLVQERYADRKDELNRWTDDWYRSSQESVSQSKEPVGQPTRKQ